jgi:hypothetical protein
MEADYSDGIFRIFPQSFHLSVQILPQVKTTSFYTHFPNHYLLNIECYEVFTSESVSN